MALQIGNVEATTGLAKAIYDQIEANMGPDIADLSDDDKTPVQEGWQKMAHAVATGVVQHLLGNMEVYGIQTSGDVNVAISGSTRSGGNPAHTHDAGSLSGSQAGAVFSQSNNGTGHIR